MQALQGHTWNALIAALVILAVGCGGKIDTGLDSLDSGTDAVTADAVTADAVTADAVTADAVTSTDAPTGTCTPIMVYIFPLTPGMVCDTIAAWSCGTTDYSVACTCGENGSECNCTSTIPPESYSLMNPDEMCTCITSQTAAAVCGFPQ